MSDEKTDTPETDAAIAIDSGDSGYIAKLANLARRLERERDDARLALETWRMNEAAWGTDAHEVRRYIKATEKERDDARAALREIAALDGVTRCKSPMEDIVGEPGADADGFRPVHPRMMDGLKVAAKIARSHLAAAGLEAT